MRRLLIGLLLLTGPAGCIHPIKTDSKVSMTDTLHTRVEMQQTSAANPVVEMPLGACPPPLPCPARKGGGPKVAIVDVDGLLLNQNLTGPYSSGDNPIDLFREKLDAAAADSAICAVVLRINSPGGSVVASDIMWQELLQFRRRCDRPVVACLMDMGTSGAYYLASACDQIVAHPMSITGGIGVVLNLYNLEDFIGVYNIRPQQIKAGEQIDTGNQLRALTPEARKTLQAMADEFHGRFKDVVRQRRPQVDAGDATTFDGRVFTAARALERRLIDRVGYIDDALALARELADQPHARAVILHRANDPARTPYATTPNVPLQSSMFPWSMPGPERTRLPTFLYLWQPDPTLERMSGR